MQGRRKSSLATKLSGGICPSGALDPYETMSDSIGRRRDDTVLLFGDHRKDSLVLCVEYLDHFLLKTLG